MKIKSYEMYREEGVCTLREEKSYSSGKKVPYFKKPQDVVEFCNGVLLMDKLPFEKMVVICMDMKGKPKCLFENGGGSFSSCEANPGALFAKILLSAYPVFCLVHNHPSGDSTPSEEDKKLTENVEKISQITGIKLLDHIIVGEDYYSFKEDGVI